MTRTTTEPWTVRSYKYRIYPTKAQIGALEDQLAFCCDLYNAALEQRRGAQKRGRSLRLYDQMRDLTDLRASLPYPEKMASHLQRDPLRRLDHAFEAFYRRCRSGEKPGYPRWRSRNRYDSLTWPISYGATIRDDRLRLQGVGAVRVNWHRQIPVEATIKTITVKRAAGRWYACFALEVPLSGGLPPESTSVGVDVGIMTFAALSTGELIPGPRAYRKAERQLRVTQRRVTRRKAGSSRRREALRILQRRHEHLRNVRRDHAHRVANSLIHRYGFIAVEDLDVCGLARGILAKDVYDQGWAQFVSLLREKAEWAAREVVLVDPRGTSQTCSDCGTLVQKTLADRVHRCYECGYVADRDVNAARNILRLGLSLQALTVGEEVRAVA